MSQKTFVIGILTVTALILGVANLLPVPRAEAAFSIKDNRYQLVTTKSARGGEVLYVIDNLTGQAAVFGWDNSSMVPIAVEPLTNLFAAK
jgi:hypothetical protein